MPKGNTKEAVVRLVNPQPKKNSVKFDADPSIVKPILTGAYIMTQAAREQLGIDINSVQALEVVVRVPE